MSMQIEYESLRSQIQCPCKWNGPAHKTNEKQEIEISIWSLVIVINRNFVSNLLAITNSMFSKEGDDRDLLLAN